MAAAELFTESPDGHAHSMGTCYSAGKKKTPNSSSSSSARSPNGEARRASQPSSRSSSTGKACRTQIAYLNSSQQALGRSASTGKDCRTSLASSSAKGVHTPRKKSESSLARCFSTEDRACTHPKGSQQGRELNTAEDCHIKASPTPNAIHAHHISQLSDEKKQTHQTCTNSDVSNMGSASSGFVAGTSKASSRAKQDDRHATQSSPRSSASSRAKQDDGPAVQLRVPEMRAPPMLHKVSSLSLKSGVGPYEVLTPRKSIEGLQGTTPRNLGGKLIKSGSFSPLGTKDRGAKGLCKNCKTSNLDSVCFIANDGKIAAANTGPATICHFHHCNSPKCAANPNYHPSSPLLCKKVSAKTQPARSEPARTKSSINVSHAKDDRIVCASVGDNDKDLPRCTQLCRKDSHIDGETLVSNQGGIKERSNEHPSVFMQGVDAQKIRSENGHSNAVAPAQSSNDANDDIQQDSLIAHEDLQRIDSKVLPYHADNELSCSDDGIDTPTTPNRSSKGAFGDLSNTELQQLSAAKASQPRKSNMERMRQKYLDTLKEQEAETVRLKKQEMQARKQAGEWMLDCAMGEILHKLAPDGEAGVKVLVEAFETIMQHSDVEVHNEEHVTQECIGLEDASTPLHA